MTGAGVPPSSAVRGLWARVRILRWPEPVRLLSFPPESTPEVLAALARIPVPFVALVRERDEVSVAVPAAAEGALRTLGPVAAGGPMTALTLDLDVDLAVSGFLLPAAARLAAAGVSIVPVCAYRKDHLLVAAADADRAVAILEGLAAECATG